LAGSIAAERYIRGDYMYQDRKIRPLSVPALKMPGTKKQTRRPVIPETGCEKVAKELREKGVYPIVYESHDGTKYQAIITFMNRELLMSEIRSGHKVIFCPFRERCLDIATLMSAKGYSCINCDVRNHPEIFDEP
jgi:hypothetical protein